MKRVGVCGPGGRRRLWGRVGLAILFGMAGCKSPQPAWTPPQLTTRPATTVTLAPGDILNVKFFGVPELNEEQAVRPDGKIALQLVGEVEAQKKTPEELRQKLVELYTPLLKKAEITIIVKSFLGRRVYVGGSVMRGGQFEMPGQMTALEAVMIAGGFDMRTAEISNVVIIRHQGGQRFGLSLDFKSALDGQQGEPFYLEPLDIVYVPMTKISRVAQWIDQHINQIVPQIGIIYTQPVGNGTIAIDTTRGRRTYY